MHERGAVLCSACSGIFLLAETGLFDGKDATVHFGYARAFAAALSRVPIHPERVLVISGRREELVSSGASTTWHDLVLYLIARYAGATAAQEVARMFALQWHQDGLDAVHRLRGPDATTATPTIQSAQAVAARALLGRQPGRGDDQALEARRAHLQAALHRRHRPARRSPTCSACASRTPSAGSSAPTRRSTRSAGASATRTRRSSGACSSASPARAGRLPQALPHSRLRAAVAAHSARGRSAARSRLTRP